MPRTEDPVRAIGFLQDGGPWVGFEHAGGGHRLVYGQPDGALFVDPSTDPTSRRRGLLAAAIAYFTDALPDPPDEMAATQADLARLVRELESLAATDGERRLVDEAIDAIDDGLAGDAVALRLAALDPGLPADPVDVLWERLRLAAGGRRWSGGRRSGRRLRGG